MTAQQLYDTTYSAANLHQEQRAKDGLKNYLVSRCLHPQKVKIYDAFHGHESVMEVPCGKCYHCRQTYINEWVTRAYCHAESFKHVYFVTLTYAPIATATNPRDRFLLDYLSDAFWQLDNKNSTGHLAYNPSCLVKAHYQNFLKRLRRYFNIDDLSYMVCGEYGHNYGRPHFHLVLFSNHEITRSMCQRAWCLVSVKNGTGQYVPARSSKLHKYYHKIGNVDFQDLVKLGAFDQETNENIMIDGKRSSARSCFSYVVKYIGKGTDCNNRRVLSAFNNLYFKTNHIDLNRELVPHTFYREDTPLYRPSVITQNDLIHENYLYPTDLHEFVQLFKPFYHVSLGTPIGSIYEKNHRDEHAQGMYKPSSLQTKGYITPKYFKRKLAESLYSLRVRSSTSQTVTYRKDNVPFLYDSLLAFAEGDSAFMDKYLHDKDTKDSVPLVSSDFSFRDCSSGLRFLIHYNDLSKLVVSSYSWSRSTGSYIHVQDIEFDAWLSYYYHQFKEYLPKYEQAQRESQKNHEFYDKSVSLFDVFQPLVNDLIHPTHLKPSERIVYSVIDEIETDIFRWQNRYETNHNYLE